MRLRAVSGIILTLLLTNILTVAFNVPPIAADSSSTVKEAYGDNPLNLTDSQEGFNQNASAEENPMPCSIDEDKWNFNETNEWADFASVDGDSAELVIGVNNGKPNSYADIEGLIGENGGKLVGTVSMGGEVRAVVADIPSANVSSFVADMRGDSLSRYIEPNIKFRAIFVPNDPYWPEQWGPRIIEADYAWNTTLGDHTVLVAVVDTGIDWDHPDLAANYVALGYDWVNSDTDPMDDEGHGTHCAGIIAAVINNSIGIAGLAQARIMAEKGLDQYGEGYEDDLADAIVHAVDEGADILSLSWGNYYASELIHEALIYAYDHGVLVVAAAGNDATSTKHFPAAFDEVIAVTATDEYDNPASWTNFGDWVELAAPGVSIYSTVWNDGYTYKSGTSMSAPHVVGVASLILSQFPNMTRDQVRLQLRFAADDLGGPGFDDYYGYGRVNARRAVEQVPPDHDLLISGWEKPRFVEPGGLAIINTTVFNLGTSNETNITVQLLVNGSVVDFGTIGFLETGTSETVNCTWTTMVEGTYNLTSYVLPVPGETLITNNVVTAMVRVGYFKYVLFDQTHGTDSIVMYGTLVTALAERGYVVDVHTYGSITSTVLVGYDAFVIPQAHDVYASEELSAIQNFVIAGGGLLVIGDDNPSIYTDLTSFAGITWAPDGYGGYTSDITPHPVTEGISTAYFSSPMSSLYVTGPAQDLIRDSGGYIMLAASEMGVLGIADEHSISDYYIGYADNFQLANNMIDWLVIKYEHDLAVTLDAPTFLNPGGSSLLNATVHNRGLSNETDVELFLLVNGTVVNNVTIPELLTGFSYTIDYLWTPTVKATYNVTAYAPPVPGENITANNWKSKFVGVFEMVKAVLLDSLGTDYGYNAFWDYLNTNWATYGSAPIVIDYTSLNKEDITIADIEATQADVLIISDAWSDTYDYGWEFSDSEIEAIKTYVLSGHGIIATSGTFDTWSAPNNQKLAELFGMNPTIWYNWGFNGDQKTTSGTFELQTPRHDELWRNVPDPYLSGSLVTLNPTPSFDWAIQGVTTGCIEALSTDHYAAVITSDRATHKGVYFTCWLEGEGQYNENNRQLFYNAIVWTRLPPYEHELAVSLEAPDFLEPGDSSLLNATVHNRGLSNETNVELFLLINGTVVTNATISELQVGASYTLSYLWTPSVEAMYNVTGYVVPVENETVTENNLAWTCVYVGLVVKAFVLDSAGTYISDIISTWRELNTNWYVYGSMMISIDYTTLDKDDITYDDLAATGSDVLVISSASDPWMGWEFTDSEIEAIKRYVREGHGLIATAGTLYYQVPNNNKLAPLFGLNETITWHTAYTDLVHIQDPLHPLFVNVPNPYTFRQVGTASPSDGRWDSNELVGGTYVALGQFEESAIVVYRGLVYISPWLEIIPSYYHFHLQLLYNAITWSCYEKPEHELIVHLESPPALKPGNSTMLNATVSNMGLSNETDVELQLLINGTIVDSVVIPELLTGSSYTLSYVWTPTEEGTYNVTVYAPPLPDEEFIENNVESGRIIVYYTLVALLKNVDPWDNPSNEEVLSLHDVPYFVFDSNDFGSIDLSPFSKVVIASDQDQAFYDTMDTYRWWFEDYVSNGGLLEIHAADWGWHGGGWVGTLPGGLQWVRYSSDYVTIVDPVHPAVTIPNLITDPELDGWSSSVHGYFGTYPANSHIVMIEDYTSYPAYLECQYGAGFIVASSQTLEWAYSHQYSLILENSLLYFKYPHELAVFLEAPAFLQPSESSLLNVTVYNLGLSNETSVELKLLIDGSIVNNATIPVLLTGSSYTLSYLWTPTTIAKYNVTAYAPPVVGENVTMNNVVTKMVAVIKLVVENVLVYTDDSTVTPSERYPIVALDNLGITYTHYADDPSGFVTALTTQTWDLVIVSHNNYYAFGNNWEELEEYVLNGGLLVLSTFDVDGSNSEPTTLWSTLGVQWFSDMSYPEPVYRWIPTHPMFTFPNTVGDLASYIEGYYDDGDHVAATTGTPIAGFTTSPTTGYASIVVGNGNRTVLISFLVCEFRYDEDGDRKLDTVELWENAIAFVAVPSEHDLHVALDAPTFLKPGDSSLLNATVLNHGLSNETDVELFLLINGTEVESVVIPELLTGSSYTLSHTWTPTIEVIYNITAYAPPVPDENVTTNNFVSKMVHVRYVTVALISDQSQLLAITPILDSMGIGYNIYNDNDIYLYTEDLDLLTSYQTVIFYTDYRHITSNEYTALESYLSSSGSLLVTGFDSLLSDGLLRDIICSATMGDNMGEPDLYVVDETHPIMNGPYGSFPAGYHIFGLYSDCDAVEADVARNAVTVAELWDGYDKIIATDGLPGKVVYWNGRGDYDWTTNVDCEATFKNTLIWLLPPRALDVYTQRGGRGEGAWSDAYAPQEEVIIFASVTHKGDPVQNKPVAFEVCDPTGYVWLFRSNSTDENGIATVSFRIPSSPVFGTWNATATGDIAEQTLNDTVTFKVGWLVEIVKVETAGNNGSLKTDFVKGKHIYFNVTVQNIAFTPKVATITIVVYDECGVPIGLVALQDWVIGPGRTEIFIIDLQIPKWAYVGVGTVYANAYTSLPQEGGTSYCPETLITFLIKAS